MTLADFDRLPAFRFQEPSRAPVIIDIAALVAVSIAVFGVAAYGGRRGHFREP